MAKKSMSIRVDPDVEARITRYATEHGTTKSDAAMHYMEMGLDTEDHGRPLTRADLEEVIGPLSARLGAVEADMQKALPRTVEVVSESSDDVEDVEPEEVGEEEAREPDAVSVPAADAGRHEWSKDAMAVTIVAIVAAAIAVIALILVVVLGMR